MSTIIRVRCIDQVLTFESTPVVASGGLDEDFVQFSFCPLWDGYEKTAVFWRTKSDAYHVMLDESDSCQLPPEVTASEGIVYFGAFGVHQDGRQRTTEVLTYRVAEGAITEGTAPSDPTPDIYTQLLAKYSEVVDLAAETLAAEQAFEQAQRAAQAAFEQAMNVDQADFEAAMTAAQAAFEQEIRTLVADGMLPDASIETVKLLDGAVTTPKLADGAVTAEKLADGAVDAYTKAQTDAAHQEIASRFEEVDSALENVEQTLTVAVSAGWVADNTNGGYTQTVDVAGILATDTPVVDVVLGADVAANRAYKEAWSSVDRVVTADGSVTLYANDRAPASAFTMQLKVVR